MYYVKCKANQIRSEGKNCVSCNVPHYCLLEECVIPSFGNTTRCV